METKGVASVRSPVRNLQHFNRGVTHEGFVDAVINEFREEYPVALDPEVLASLLCISFLRSQLFPYARSIPIPYRSFVHARLRPLWLFQTLLTLLYRCRL